MVIDAYTTYPEIAVIKSTFAFTTSNQLSRVFATHGLPSRVKTDNGPPFNSKELRDYMNENGIYLRQQLRYGLKRMRKLKISMKYWKRPFEQRKWKGKIGKEN